MNDTFRKILSIVLILSLNVAEATRVAPHPDELEVSVTEFSEAETLGEVIEIDDDLLLNSNQGSLEELLANADEHIANLEAERYTVFLETRLSDLRKTSLMIHGLRLLSVLAQICPMMLTYYLFTQIESLDPQRRPLKKISGYDAFENSQYGGMMAFGCLNFGFAGALFYLVNRMDQSGETFYNRLSRTHLSQQGFVSLYASAVMMIVYGASLGYYGLYQLWEVRHEELKNPFMVDYVVSAFAVQHILMLFSMIVFLPAFMLVRSINETEVALEGRRPHYFRRAPNERPGLFC